MFISGSKRWDEGDKAHQWINEALTSELCENGLAQAQVGAKSINSRFKLPSIPTIELKIA